MIDSSSYGVALKVFVYVLYMIAAMGLTVLPFLVCAEILPLRIRSFGMAVISVAFWGWNFVLTAMFSSLVNWFGGSNEVMLLFGVATLVGVVFIWACVPETYSGSLEDIEKKLMRS